VSFTRRAFAIPTSEATVTLLLFQKDDGTAGVVLGNAAGRHRGEMKLSPDGTVSVTLFDGDGGKAYSIAVARDGTVRGGR
jgi:hypothetical protein